ncbi:hydroxyethylthiazole kinase [Tepidamorphus sp. 3E244]|uniref:hydroxyethylthiazole kinase n=1 Tax=Tepidamorphus sp. 3E244 TaxID=3385498 RepID=UPI0038FC2C17
MSGENASRPEDIAAAAADALANLRERQPRIHVITNTVAQPITANILIAAGAVPSMTVSPVEVPDFAARCDALLVNLGTLDEDRRSAIPGALDVVGEEGTPWVLDPVFVDVSSSRMRFTREILKREPWVLRCNRAEATALAEAEGYSTEMADKLALDLMTVLLVTGRKDYLTNGSRHRHLNNGNPLLGQVTGTGCAGSALTAAFLAVTHDPFVAAGAAAALLGVAAEHANQGAEGPGSFAWRLVDAVYSLSPADLARHARFS